MYEVLHHAVEALANGRRYTIVGASGAPLYVGKAERSLASRDLRTHFATGKTGSSTLRRSVAALLRSELDLHAVPRNLALADGSANFALEPPGDRRLTEWMQARLQLAFWVLPEDLVLDQVETAVVNRHAPPLNLVKMGPRGNRRVKAERAILIAETREWHKLDDAPGA